MGLREFNTISTEKGARQLQDYTKGIIDGVSDVAKPVEDVSNVINQISGFLDVAFEAKTEEEYRAAILKYIGIAGDSKFADSILRYLKEVRKPMCKQFPYLPYLVAECLNQMSSKMKHKPKRFILPLGEAITDIEEPDDSNSANIALGKISPQDANWREMGYAVNKPKYVDTFAIASIKTTNTNEQLLKYTRPIYEAQLNRRFVWGLSVCGTVVHSFLIGSNLVLQSTEMDLSNDKGRRELVKLLVYWAYCEESQLGYDPTMAYDKDRDIWLIQVHSADDNGAVTSKTYYGRNVMLKARRLFGRHTRCIVAKENIEDFEDESAEQTDILIKYSWTQSKENAIDDDGDEIRHLQDIKEGLADKSELDGKYPEYLAGGRVYINGKEDTTKNILGTHIWSQLGDTAIRVHKRVVIKGIGKPLSKLKSIAELVTVAADVMEVHTEIYRTCRILHMDIYYSNILVRYVEGKPLGMLIDFDLANNLNKSGKLCKGKVGTPIFMSINNLEDNDNERTALDDWESLIYLLCWIGTFGWETDGIPDNIQHFKKEAEHVFQWTCSQPAAKAQAKRSLLHSAENFKQITNGFRDVSGKDELVELVHELREVLIEGNGEDASGSLQTMSKPDPFSKRPEMEREIVNKLLVVLRRHSMLAKKHLGM